MRHQPRHEKGSAHGTRFIAGALVLIVGAVSLAAVTLPMQHGTTTRSAQARQGDRPLPAGVAPDVVAFRLDVPGGVKVRTRRSSGGIVRNDVTPPSLRLPWRAKRCLVADRDGDVARGGGFDVVGRNAPGSMPPLLCFSDDARDVTRQYAAWRTDG